MCLEIVWRQLFHERLMLKVKDLQLIASVQFAFGSYSWSKEVLMEAKEAIRLGKKNRPICYWWNHILVCSLKEGKTSGAHRHQNRSFLVKKTLFTTSGKVQTAHNEVGLSLSNTAGSMRKYSV